MEEKSRYNTATIAEMTGGIILAHFEKDLKVRETAYQSESALEEQMIENLISQGYERLVVKSKGIIDLVEAEKLKEDSKRFIEKAISRGYVEYAGDELDRIIPPTSRRGGGRKKSRCLKK